MTQSGKLSIDDLRDLTGGRPGKSDTICPLCMREKSRAGQKRKVLRVWDDGDSFVTYHCERCQESGWAKADGTVSTSKPRPTPLPAEPEQDKSETARFLWERSKPAAGTIVEKYLRSRKCWESDLARVGHNIRFLPERGDHAPSMIARFGTEQITGAHMTRLRPDGSGKAGTDADKVMLGPSIGQPIVVYDNPDGLELFISEGIEDAASWAIATGFTSWAAGSWSRMAAAVEAAQGFEKVFFSSDHDLDGLKALERAREIKPNLIDIDLTRMFNPAISQWDDKRKPTEPGLCGGFVKWDANKVLQEYDGKMLVSCKVRAETYSQRPAGLYQRRWLNREATVS